MAQYLPFGDVAGVDQLNRRLTQGEYDRVSDHLLELGLVNQVVPADELLPTAEKLAVQLARGRGLCTQTVQEGFI